VFGSLWKSQCSRVWGQKCAVESPSVFGRNLQCEPVRGVGTREEWHWSHACKSFKRSNGVKLNDNLECVNYCRKTRTANITVGLPQACVRSNSMPLGCPLPHHVGLPQACVCSNSMPLGCPLPHHVGLPQACVCSNSMPLGCPLPHHVLPCIIYITRHSEGIYQNAPYYTAVLERAFQQPLPSAEPSPVLQQLPTSTGAERDDATQNMARRVDTNGAAAAAATAMLSPPPPNIIRVGASSAAASPTIQGGVNLVPDGQTAHWTIEIEAGIYMERVWCARFDRNLHSKMTLVPTPACLLEALACMWRQ
jgi:hypothetical protein